MQDDGAPAGAFFLFSFFFFFFVFFLFFFFFYISSIDLTFSFSSSSSALVVCCLFVLPVRICSFVALDPAGAHAMRIPIIAAKLYLLVCCLYCAGFGESPGLHVVCSLCAFRHPDIPVTGSVPDAEGTLGFRSHFRYLSIFIEEKSLTFAERWASFVKIRDRHQKAGI